jgi:CBS domain-containing protein
VEVAMKKTVREIMSMNVGVVRHWETLDHAARIMWERDVGCVPVVDEANELVGIVTDRDVCIGAYTQGLRLADIHVGSVCTRTVLRAEPETTLEEAAALMRAHRVRRLPVCDVHGCVVGMLSLADLAVYGMPRTAPSVAEGLSPSSLASTLAAVSEPRPIPSGQAALPRVPPTPRAAHLHVS